MPTRSDFQFMRRALTLALERGRQYVLPSVRNGVRGGFGSRQLARSLVARVDSATQGRLFIPHYWAVYVHDGRAGFSASRTRWLVWFRDPKDDPRLQGGLSPLRATHIRRLTRQQFQAGLERNREDPGFMRLAKRVGPVRPSPFFENEAGGGMHRFKDEAGKIISREFSNHLKQDRLKDVLNIKDSVTIRL